MKNHYTTRCNFYAIDVKENKVDIEEIKVKLEDRNLVVVAERCNIGYVTLSTIANGKNKNPKYETVKRVSDYLETH